MTTSKDYVLHMSPGLLRVPQNLSILCQKGFSFLERCIKSKTCKTLGLDKASNRLQKMRDLRAKGDVIWTLHGAK